MPKNPFTTKQALEIQRLLQELALPKQLGNLLWLTS